VLYSLRHPRGALLEMMTDGVLVLERAGRVIFTNRAATETLELGEAALTGALGLDSLGDAPRDWRSEIPGALATRWLDVRIGPNRRSLGRVGGSAGRGA
jgi:PAS domain-containing protein